ncbi:MAG: hypothetical protein ABMA13_10475 [Chthoniobacteraceae bacterium]
MKYLRWGDKDPRCVYGNKNLRWGSPASYLLEPGDEGYVELQPGDFGYVPPEPRRRRPTISVESLNLPPNMQPFRYLIALIHELFTSRPVLRPAMPEGTYLDTLATRAQLTRAQVEKLVTEQAALHVELARQGIPVDFILKRFRMLPSSGGRYSGPDPDNGEVCDTLNYSIVIHPDEIDKMRVDCPLEKTGEVGMNAPEIASVRGRPGNAPNRYGVGTAQATEVNGLHFRDRRADAPWPTAALVDANGGNPIALTVLDSTPTRLLLGGAPAGTTGMHHLKITDADGGFGISDDDLTPV